MRTTRTPIDKWPGTVADEFRPFAIQYAYTFHNAPVRSSTGKSPHHMFTSSEAPWCLEDFRVFGSLVYVLDKCLQDGDSLPKWKARSWLGVYVGQLLVHAGNILIIYNPIMTHVSLQCHMVFDDQSTSITHTASTILDNFYLEMFYKVQWFVTEVTKTLWFSVYSAIY